MRISIVPWAIGGIALLALWPGHVGPRSRQDIGGCSGAALSTAGRSAAMAPIRRASARRDRSDSAGLGRRAKLRHSSNGTPAAPDARRPSGSPVLRMLPIAGLAVALDKRAGRVFVLSSLQGGLGPGQVSILDAQRGVLLCTVRVPPSPVALAVDEQTQRVFIATADRGTVGQVIMLDVRSGAMLRTVRLPGVPEPGGAPLAIAAGSGQVFVASTAQQGKRGFVTVLDARTGARVRAIRVGPDPTAVAVVERTGRVFVTNYLGKSVSVLAIAHARLLQTVSVGLYPSALAVDGATRHVVVANAGSGSVSLLDAASGRVQHTTTLTLGNAPDVLGVDQRTRRVFAAPTGEGYVSMLDARSGRLLRTIDVGLSAGHNPAAAPTVDDLRGRIFLLVTSLVGKTNSPTGPGGVVVLDAATGAVRARLTVGAVSVGGGIYHAMAVDAATRRLFVLTNDRVYVLDTTHL